MNKFEEDLEQVWNHLKSFQMEETRIISIERNHSSLDCRDHNMKVTVAIVALCLMIASTDGRPQVITSITAFFRLLLRPFCCSFQERERRSALPRPTIPLTIFNVANLFGLSPFNPPPLPSINNSAVRTTINLADFFGREPPSRG